MQHPIDTVLNAARYRRLLLSVRNAVNRSLQDQSIARTAATNKELHRGSHYSMIA